MFFFKFNEVKSYSLLKYYYLSIKLTIKTGILDLRYPKAKLKLF